MIAGELHAQNSWMFERLSWQNLRKPAPEPTDRGFEANTREQGSQPKESWTISAKLFCGLYGG